MTTHTIKARRDGKEKLFTIQEWNALPRHKYGWCQIKDVPTPPEAKKAIESANNTATKPEPPADKVDGNVIDFEAMDIFGLQNFAELNNLKIDDYKNLPKSKLLKAIKKLVQNG